MTSAVWVRIVCYGLLLYEVSRGSLLSLIVLLVWLILAREYTSYVFRRVTDSLGER